MNCELSLTTEFPFKFLNPFQCRVYFRFCGSSGSSNLLRSGLDLPKLLQRMLHTLNDFFICRVIVTVHAILFSIVTVSVLSLVFFSGGYPPWG